MMATIKRYFWDVCRGVKNLLAYFPIIWRDRDWDYCFIADLLEFKLRRMAKRFEDLNVHANSNKYARQMRVCAELLKRVREDQYAERAIEAEKIGYGVWHFVELESGGSLIEFVDDGYENRRKYLYLRAEQQQENDLKYFAKIFSKYFTRWLD